MKKIIFLIAILFFATTASAATATNKGLVAYYSFDDGSGTRVEDSSGNGNHGLLKNATHSAWVAGKMGKSIDFDGIDDQVVINAGLSQITDAHTISAWFRLLREPIDRDVSPLIIGGKPFSSSGSLHGIALSIYEGNNRFYYDFYDDDKRSLCISPESVASWGTGWHHVAAVWQGLGSGTDGKDLWIDGVKVDDAGPEIDTPINWSGLSESGIGGHSKAGSYPFEGQIDEVRIYDRALTDSEILDLFNEKRITVSNTPTNLITDGLVFHQTFDGPNMDWSNTSAEARDISGNSIHGNAINNASTGSGKIGQAIRLDGDGDYVDCGENTELELTDDFTVAAWIYPESLHSTDYYGLKNCIIHCGQAGSTTVNYQLQVTDATTITFIKRVSPDALSFYSYSNVPSLLQRWAHVLFVVSDGNASLYVDGVLIETKAIAALAVGTERLFYIGTSVNTRSEPCFDGMIDDVRLYNRVLSADEIQTLAGAGKVTVGFSHNNIMTDGLVLLQSFNGQDVDMATGTCYDRSGHGNNGTMSGGVAPKSGRLGQAMEFDGVNGGVNCGNIDELDGHTAFTVAAWIKLDEDEFNSDGDIFVQGVHNVVCSIILWRDDVVAGGDQTGNTNCLSFIVMDGSDKVWISSANNTLNDTGWHFVCGTFEANNAAGSNIYIDGTLVETGSAASVDNINATVLDSYIGMSSNLVHYFDGKIDEVRIYNRALSAQEIEDLYNLGGGSR